MGTETEEADSSRGPAAQGGRSVGDLLSAIGDVCDRCSDMDPFELPEARIQYLLQRNVIKHA